MKALSKLKVCFYSDESLDLISAIKAFFDEQPISVVIEEDDVHLYVVAYGSSISENAWLTVQGTNLELSRYMPSAITAMESFSENDEDVGGAFYEGTRELMQHLKKLDFQLDYVSYALFDEAKEPYTSPCGKCGYDETNGLQDQEDGWRMITIYDLDD